jgi:integrase
MSEQHKLRVIKPSTSEYQTISNAIVAKALPRQKEYFIRDNQLRGFYVRVKPSGAKTYGIQARKNRTGSPVSRAIGSTSRYSCKEARTLAREWLQEISQGIDPKESKKGELTLIGLLEEYLSTRSLAPKTAADYRYNFQHYLSSFAKKSLKDLSTESLVKWYIAGKDHPVGTERTFVTLNTILNFAQAMDYIQANPARKAAQIVTRYTSRKSEEHLRSIYLNLSPFVQSFLKAEISDVMRDWILLALTTGLRREESMTLEWSQVDLKEKVVAIPNNKANRFLLVPMIGLTYDMFQSRFNSEDKDSRYVFVSKHGVPIKDARKALARICKTAQIPSIAHHDLRRLFASVCHELDLSEEEIAKLLNHSTKSVTDIYIHKSLESLRRKYQKVADHLDRQIVFSKPEGKEENIVTATELLRASFYRKVSPIPDPPVSAADMAFEKHKEDEYWEG